MRYYNIWAGNPKGVPEDVSRCVVEVWVPGGGIHCHQCCRKRGHGAGRLFCKQHAEMGIDGLHVPRNRPNAMSPYKEGYAARKSDTNPHKTGSQEAQDWNAGRADASDEGWREPEDEEQ